MSPRAERALREVHLRLQVPQAPSVLDKLPGYPAHAGQLYHLEQRTSRTSTEGFDVQVVFSDGYQLYCVVVIYPGRDPYLGCREGAWPP